MGREGETGSSYLVTVSDLQEANVIDEELIWFAYEKGTPVAIVVAFR